MKNCFLLCVIGLIIACIICCRVNVTLDMILGTEDILISWFVITLALLDVASLFACCMIHCKHLRLSDANKRTYLLTYLPILGLPSIMTYTAKQKLDTCRGIKKRISTYDMANIIFFAIHRGNTGSTEKFVKLLNYLYQTFSYFVYKRVHIEYL